MDRNTIFNVKNRSAGVIVICNPEASPARRSFAPGEVKRMTYDELEKFSFQPGGREMLRNYLQVQSVEAIKELDMKVEPEYNMSENDIKELLLNGSQDQFLDTLDFAPTAVIDLIKAFAVSLPLNDLNKRQALLKKTGFNVDEAIKNSGPDEEENIPQEEAPVRRVKVEEPTGRRANIPEYKIVEPK